MLPLRRRPSAAAFATRSNPGGGAGAARSERANTSKWHSPANSSARCHWSTPARASSPSSQTNGSSPASSVNVATV